MQIQKIPNLKLMNSISSWKGKLTKCIRTSVYFIIVFQSEQYPFAVNAKVHSPWTELNAYY